ncbi:hypothetical protein PVAND_009591 [Polypedilum vanderplanki]|uniref:Uncharacterized protein n=1 Tax=Polypedilum vanderplanki TaxID=319348 RepID=A0A9J6CDQ8_POLVA|nr:hypothetical protein PVAND_009591 [Polypedilum vanderplanki]
MMKFKFFTFLFLINSINTQVEVEVLPKYFHEDVDCTASFSCLSPFCNLNKFLDYKSTITFGCFLWRPLSKIFVQQITKQKDGVSPFYNTLSKSPIYDWCEVMENAETNPIYKLLVEFFGNVAPEIMHKCPYWGSVTAFNLTFNMDKFFTFYSPGVYKNILFIFDDVDSEIFKLRIYTRVF